VKDEFRLRFPMTEVMFWAARSSYADDGEVEAMGRAAGARGWYTRDEFLTVTRWKTQRSKSRCESNDEASVEAATRLALSTPDEQRRIEAFTRLRGVAYPTASVLLHFARPDAYPIIDFRALWSLGWDSPPTSYTFAFWWAYTVACRSLAKNAGVTVRTLDRALWQYSKAHQPPTAASAVQSTDTPEAPVPVDKSESKSAVMRRHFAEGRSVSEVAKALNVDYSFAYGVRKRRLEAQTELLGQQSGMNSVLGRVGAAVGKRVLGIDGAEGGWFAVLLVDGYFAEADFQPSVSALISQFPGVDVIAIDIPIRLPVGKSRPADAAARKFVGPARAASVFPTPPAEVLAAPTYAEAVEIARRLVGTGISQQTWALRGRIFEVADIAASDHRIVEVHPEVSFRALKGEPLRYPKKDSWSGGAERRALLGGAGIFISDELPGGERAAPDDVVDAAAAAWSAMRVAEGKSSTLPEEPSRDPADGGVINY
jgi:predicted RNase H-like nuclease